MTSLEKSLHSIGVLDLRSGRQLSSEHAAMLDEIAEELRKPYVKLISDVSSNHESSLDWWVTSFAVRNTYTCKLFERLCKIALINRAFSESEIDCVLVDDPLIAKEVEETIPGNLNVVCTQSLWHWYVRVLMRLSHRFLTLAKNFSVRILFSAITRSNRQSLPSEFEAVIETVVYDNSLRGSLFYDRHFPGLLDGLKVSEQQKCSWLPYYYGITNYSKLFVDLRANKGNFLVPEDFLKLSDYFYALFSFTRTPYRFPNFDFMGSDVSSLMRNSFVENLVSHGSSEALLRYRLIRRMSEHGIRVKKVIDWYENQEIDHGTIAAWKKYYPRTKIVGYKGFLASRFYLCDKPIALEVSHGFVPHEIAVLGSLLVETEKEFCKELSVIVAPAYRFSLPPVSMSVQSRDTRFSVLVTLPLKTEESSRILSLVKSLLDGTNSGDVKSWDFIVKRHPASKVSFASLEELLERDNVMSANDPLSSLMNRTRVLISSASTTCVEAIVSGMPVAVISSNTGVTHNPIPLEMRKKFSMVCANAKDLFVFLEGIRNLSKSEQNLLVAAGREYRDGIFSSPSTLKSKALLGLS